MEKITDISQLNQGDQICSIAGKNIIIYEYLCLHPHNSKYSIFLDKNQDPLKKVYNSSLKDAEWYRYDNSKNTRRELYQKIVQNQEKYLEQLKKRLEMLK